MRLIAGIDNASLAAYCSAVATYQEADERLKTEKWTTTTARGGSRPNPLFKIRDDALKLVNKFAAEFGLTPSTRASCEAFPPRQGNRRSRIFSMGMGARPGTGKLPPQIWVGVGIIGRQRRG